MAKGDIKILYCWFHLRLSFILGFVISSLILNRTNWFERYRDSGMQKLEKGNPAVHRYYRYYSLQYLQCNTLCRSYSHSLCVTHCVLKVLQCLSLRACPWCPWALHQGSYLFVFMSYETQWPLFIITGCSTNFGGAERRRGELICFSVRFLQILGGELLWEPVKEVLQCLST